MRRQHALGLAVRGYTRSAEERVVFSWHACTCNPLNAAAIAGMRSL